MDTGYAETVRISYDPSVVSLEDLVDHYFEIVGPIGDCKDSDCSKSQYRKGIYYTDEQDRAILEDIFAAKRAEIGEEPSVELEPIEVFYVAEDYHQDYYKKNPGYDSNVAPANAYGADEGERERSLHGYTKPSAAEIKSMLTDEQFETTQNSSTEPAFSGEYDQHFERGIYVDVVTGQPLFSSADKYHSASGWPVFSKPIDASVLAQYEGSDQLGAEVRSEVGDTHLGHLYYDGPILAGGRHYCINSNSLRFIPYEDMDQEGCGPLKAYC